MLVNQFNKKPIKCLGYRWSNPLLAEHLAYHRISAISLYQGREALIVVVVAVVWKLIVHVAETRLIMDKRQCEGTIVVYEGSEL